MFLSQAFNRGSQPVRYFRNGPRMKTTLRCYAHVRRSVHPGNADTSTTLELILQLLGSRMG